MSFNLPEHFLEQESFLEYCLQSNAEAVAHWEDYARQHPEHAEIMAEAKEHFFLTRNLVIAERYKPLAMVAMRQYMESEASGNARNARLITMRRWVAAAAVVLVVVTSWWWIAGSKRQPVVIGKQYASQTPVYYFDNKGKERKGITLSDGSFVLLDNNATLRIDSGFGKKERRIYLEGTAWFNVARDKDRVFSVVTGDYVTTALGTAFRIQYLKDNSIKVDLEEGKVMVAKNNNGVFEPLATLFPSESESITLGKQEKTTAQKINFSVPQLKAWKAEDIIFDKAPLTDVLQQLQQVYDLQISVEDTALLKETFTGRFHQDGFTEVLDMICFSLNKQYKLTEGNKVLIY
jgi:ferric-dicitrate binding protein FerR (iron transport regulator)